MTDIKSHRLISNTRMETDEETGDPVLVVETPLDFNPDSSMYNKAAIDELSEHVSAWQQENWHRATIEGTWSQPAA